jgi:Flp pilus assembly protein TadB
MYRYFIIAILVFMLSGSILTRLLSLENYNIHKKRLKQLQFEKKEETTFKDLVDKTTNPLIDHIFSKITFKDLDKLERKLKMAGWDKTFTPIKYKAFNITLKVVGALLVFVISKISIALAAVWGFVTIFFMDILFYDAVKSRKSRMIAGFSDVMRVIQGFLSSEMTFDEALKESVRYASDDWRPILKEVAVRSTTHNTAEALQYMKDEVDIFEVREFVALLNLILEQGGNAKDSFDAQNEKIKNMIYDTKVKEIEKRDMKATILQLPILLTHLMVLAMPIINALTSSRTL